MITRRSARKRGHSKRKLDLMYSKRANSSTDRLVDQWRYILERYLEDARVSFALESLCRDELVIGIDITVTVLYDVHLIGFIQHLSLLSPQSSCPP